MFETIDHLLPFLANGSEVAIIIGAVVLGMRIYAGAVEKANDRYRETAKEAVEELAKHKDEANKEQEKLRDELASLRNKTDNMWVELIQCRQESARFANRIELLELRLKEHLPPIDDDPLL